jgi:transposase
LLRLVRGVPDAAPPDPQVIGVDDWALRKGHDYGTLIIDLERHQPIDMLPDRTAETFAAWLKQYPTIRIVSRDRASSYADGAAEGAPDALQVADRWHLLRKLGEALQRVLAHHPAALRSAAEAGEDAQAEPVPASATGGAEQSPATPPATPDVAPQPEPARTSREQQFRAVLELHAQGWRYRQIAAELHLDRRTVRRYILGGEVPKRGAPGIQRTSSIQPYRAYVERRWQAGCQHGMELWRELQAQGYRGSYASMCRALKWLRQGDGRRTHPATPATPKPRALSPRQAMWVLIRPAEQLSDDEQAARTALCVASEAIATASTLAQSFQQMVTTRDAAALDDWLAAAKVCEVAELRQFAASLQRDYVAVKAGLSEVWSNGQLEGQVNRLKLLKRQMYGRANFDLLRKRVLHAA